MTTTDRNTRATALAATVGLDLTAPPVPVGAYTPAVRHGDTVHLSGQIPKIGDHIASLGPVGSEVTPGQAKEAARICALRLLGVIISIYGSLDDSVGSLSDGR